MWLKDMPRRCECGNEYNISHCLTCKKGGFIHMRHNAVQHSVHDIVKDVCKDVKIEPPIIPLTGKTLSEVIVIIIIIIKVICLRHYFS